jgi:hypothetical protein
MRQVLLIDDLRTIDVPEAKVVVARTAREGLKEIQGKSWDTVLLDHDLGPGGDVRDIVRLLEERGFNGDPLPIRRIVVVTKNPVAAVWIAKGLERYYDVAVRSAPLVIPSKWA